MKYLIILLFLFGCSAETKEDSTNGSLANPDSVNYARLTGYVQDGPCLSAGSVMIHPLDSNLLQTTEHYTGKTLDDFGHYDVPSEVPNQFAEVFIQASCYNEVTGQLMADKELDGIIDLTDGDANNINPLTTIRTPIIRSLFNSGFGTISQCIDESETRILDYLGLPYLSVRFTAMDLTNAGTHDAVLLAVNSAFLLNKTESEQADFMNRVSQDIIAGETTHQSEIRTALSDLPIMTVKNNLESRYAELGHTLDTPPFWNIIDSDGDGMPNSDDSDSFVELLNREIPPVIQYTKNLLETGTASSPSSIKFAIPMIFNDKVNLSNYIGTNISGDNMSIFTHKTRNDCQQFLTTVTCDLPDTEVLTVPKIQENFFCDTYQDTTGDSYSNLPSNYHGYIGGNTLVQGQKYYMIVSKETAYTISKATSGHMMPFGKLLFWDEGCAVATDICTEGWVGYESGSPVFNRDGVKIFLTD